jgi:hypothetical protein
MSEAVKAAESFRRATQIDQLRRAINGQATTTEPEPKPPAQIVQLPIWPEQTRGTPNPFLRGALFAAIQGKERRALKRELLTCQKGQSIRFTGWQLDQSDLDVWEQAAELARSHPLGNVCHFRINAFLRALDRNTGKSEHEWLKGSFARLAGCCVEITCGRYTYGGALLEFVRDDDTGEYVLRLNPTILSMYKAGWTAIDWDIRQKLRRKPLALWLHGFYSSHAQPYPIKVDTLRELSGSANKESRDFKRKLKAAFADLEAAARIKGTIDGGLVTVERKPTPAQVRHIVKKASRQPSKA